ncbi:hypothetical protein [Kordia sp.]|uniref:hypothetical protein n=1 Tax=Kordia sp. TaxID=1965332 RepID=UPI003D6B5B61
MRKQILFTLITLFSITSVFAQPGMKKKVKQAKLLKEKILLVPIEDSEFGERFKAAVQEIWTFNENVKFVTEEEFKTFLKNKKERETYAYLNYADFISVGLHPGNIIKVSLLGKAAPIYYVTVSSEYLASIPTLNSSKVISTNKKEEISKADLLFAVKQLQNHVFSFSKYKKMSRKEAMKAYKEGLDGVKVLKNKTLLIEENTLTRKALKKIKSIYKYDYKIVTKEVIEDAIVNSYEDKVYIKGLAIIQPPMTSNALNSINDYGTFTMVTYGIYDSVTNESIYAFIPTSKVSISIAVKKKISLKDLKKLAADIK